MHLNAARGSRLSILGLLALLAVSLPAWAGIPPSPPPSWIHDDAGLLKPAELNELTLVRERLEKKSGTRLVVVTLADSGGQSSKSIAVDTLNRWNAGRQSALLLVTMSPRELYIQPGTDLADVLDADTASSICSGVIAPKLRSGERGAALRAGLEAIASRIVIAGDSPQSLAEADAATATATPVRSSWASSETLGFAAYGGGVLALLGGILGVRHLLRRKCPECGSRMHKRSEVITPASYTAPGEGRHHFSCTDCGRTASEIYFIAQLTESTSSSDRDWSSSSSSSSWSSSDYSSSSSSDSSSSSSSDGSGGGGSTW